VKECEESAIVEGWRTWDWKERQAGGGPTYVGWRLVLADASALVRQGEAALVLARLLCDRLWD
jgi:hypothetical protein